MSDDTPRLGLPQLADAQELVADTINDALVQLDAVTDLYLKGQFVDAPPAAPADGDVYLTGGAPSGAWSGYAYKLAYCLDGGWRFFTPFNGLRAFVATTGAFIVYQDGVWTDWNSLISASEVSIASAATCDLGAAGSLFVQITGATAITGFGTAANRLRFVRFAGALTLTHDATGLVLLGGASRVTAAGDMGIYTSDGAGHWRERSYVSAAGTWPMPFLGVGPATPGGWTGNARQEVAQTADGADGLSVYDSAASGNAVLVRVDHAGVNLTQFHYGASAVGSITTDGSATAFNTTSDARLKRVPPDQACYRDAIRALWVGDFLWKDSGRPGFGVLAQQAWEVMPNHQGVTRPDDDAAPWQASAEPFGQLALWGVKDLYALLEALAARLRALEQA